MLALTLALAVFAGGSATEARESATGSESETPREPAPEQRDFAQEERDRKAKMIARLVQRGDPAAVDYVTKAVDRGLPPVVLGSFLDAAREHPQAAYVPRLRRHLRHRSRHVTLAEP